MKAITAKASCLVFEDFEHFRLFHSSSIEKINTFLSGLGGSVLIGKNCALSLWHSFSQYRPPGQQTTYMHPTS